LEAFEKAPTLASQPINVPSDNEDIERTTPDPISLWSEDDADTRQTKVASGSKPKPLPFHSISPLHRALPTDGPATRRLNERYRTNVNRLQDSQEVIIVDDDLIEPGHAPIVDKTSVEEIDSTGVDNIGNPQDLRLDYNYSGVRAASPTACSSAYYSESLSSYENFSC
jgi:hypothetical protein